MEQGAVAGTAVEPLGGQVIGAVAGAPVGVVADYVGNEANEAINRDQFLAANEAGAGCHDRNLEIEFRPISTRLSINGSTMQDRASCFPRNDCMLVS